MVYSTCSFSTKYGVVQFLHTDTRCTGTQAHRHTGTHTHYFCIFSSFFHNKHTHTHTQISRLRVGVFVSPLPLMQFSILYHFTCEILLTHTNSQTNSHANSHKTPSLHILPTRQNEDIVEWLLDNESSAELTAVSLPDAPVRAPSRSRLALAVKVKIFE